MSTLNATPLLQVTSLTRITRTAGLALALVGISSLSSQATAAPGESRSLIKAERKAARRAPSWTQSETIVGFVANTAGDTIRIKLRNADELLVVTRKPGAKRMRGLRETDLNVLIARIDDALQAQDTGRAITLRRADGSPDTSVQVVRIPSTRSTASSDNDRKVTISIRRPDKGGIDVVVNEEEPATRSDSDTTRPKRRRSHRHRNLTDFSFMLGLNNYLSRDNGALSQPVGLERLRPIGSRFVGLGVSRLVPFTRESRTGVSFGVELAWNNFMVGQPTEIRPMIAPGMPTRTEFGSIDPVLESQPGYRFRKHKLTVATLRLPVMFHIPLGRSSSLDLGGWAGLRLDDYTRSVYRVEGQVRRVRERQQLYINDFQAALRAKVKVGGIGFFADYHLTPLFAQGRGPELVPYSVGIVL